MEYRKVVNNMLKIKAQELMTKLEELLIHDPISFGYVQALTDIRLEDIKEIQRKKKQGIHRN